MSALAVMFIAMGIADVCRLLTRRLWPPVTVAPVVSSESHCWPGCGTSATSRYW